MVLLFGGKQFTYTGEFEIKDISTWVHDKISRSSTELTKHNFNSLYQYSTSCGYFGPKNYKWFEYLALAARNTELPFYHSFDPELREMNYNKQLSLFRQHGKKPFDFNSKWTPANLQIFVEENRYPTIQSLDTDAAYNRIVQKKTPVIILFADNFDNKNGAQNPFFKNTELYGNRVAFMTADINNEVVKDFLNYVGISHISSKCSKPHISKN